jgi:hypothetical protein
VKLRHLVPAAAAFALLAAGCQSNTPETPETPETAEVAEEAPAVEEGAAQAEEVDEVDPDANQALADVANSVAREMHALAAFEPDELPIDHLDAVHDDGWLPARHLYVHRDGDETVTLAPGFDDSDTPALDDVADTLGPTDLYVTDGDAYVIIDTGEIAGAYTAVTEDDVVRP